MQKTRGISAISFLVGLNVVIYLLLAWVFISPKQTCGFDSYAKDAIPNLVRQVYLSSDSALKENEEFFKGDEIFPRDAIGASPINLTAVTFDCAERDFCQTAGSPLQIIASASNRTYIAAMARTMATIGVCRDSAGIFHVIVGNATKDVQNSLALYCNES